TRRQTIVELQQQVYAAEEAMYAVFNAFNDDDKYDIECHWQTRVNSNLDIRECRPRFFDMANEEIAENFYRGYFFGLDDAPEMHYAGDGIIFNSPPLQAVVAYRYPILKEKLRKVILEHPEFMEAI